MSWVLRQLGRVGKGAAADVGEAIAGVSKKGAQGQTRRYADKKVKTKGASLKELLNQYRINQRRIKLINKALQSQQRGALTTNTKRSLRQGYRGGPDMEPFEGLTGIRKNQAGIIKRLRSMGYSTPSRAFKSSR